MTLDALFDIAGEMNCSIEVVNEPATDEADAHERYNFWHGDLCIFALAIRNREMAWPGYMLVKALMDRLKEAKS